jgi:hypothetical protein
MRPAELTGEPTYVGVQRYGCLILGDRARKFPFCLDVQDGGKTILYFDCNANYDLSDDGGPHTNQARSPGSSRDFACEVAIPWKLLRDNCPLDGDFRIWLFVNEQGWQMEAASHYSRTALIGSASVNGRRYTAYLIDDGYNDADLTNDGVVIDLNDDGEIDQGEGPAKAFLIGGQRYKIAVTW